MDIEKLATSAITNCIAGTDFLSPWISEGDREPSWDGFIYAYSNKNQAKKNLTGRAAVQVKGKQVKNVKKKSIQYPVSMVDLENYRNDGGTIFFVVGITSELEEKIYYLALPPFKINQYLKIYKGKKTPSLTFSELPEKKNDIENIVINFVNDSRKQAIAQNGKNWTIPEVEKLVGIENMCLNFSVTCIGYDRNDPFPYLKNNEFYMYAGNKDNSIQFPVEHIENIEVITCERECAISAQNKKFYDRIRVERHREGTITVYIGKSIYIKYEKNGKGTFKYTLKGNLDERIITIEFMLAMYEDAGFYLDGTKFGFEQIQEKLDADEHREKLQYLNLVKELLDKFGVNKPLEADNLSEKNEKDIRMLIDTQLYGKRASFQENDDIPEVGYISIANINLLVMCTKMEDGTYLLEDFFRKEISCSMDKTPSTQTSQYSLMSVEDYLKADNFSREMVEVSFKKHKNISHYSQTNFSVLNILNAYDRDNSRGDLLDLAEHLYEWLISEQPDEDIYQINLIQCHKRRGILTDKDVLKLNEIGRKADITNALLAGIQILLENYQLATIYLEQLDESDRKEFENYPIYNLMKQET